LNHAEQYESIATIITSITTIISIIIIMITIIFIMSRVLDFQGNRSTSAC
jgi:heme/copper-type cytochrome/quinol oxidase subunit 2